MHYFGSPFSARRILVGANDGAVYNDQAILSGFKLQRLEDRCPVATMRPIRESIVDGLP